MSSSKKKKVEIVIKKAELQKGIYLYVEYSMGVDGGMDTIKRGCSGRVHNDLKDKFAQLNEHLAVICEQFDENGTIVTDLVSCTSFTISKADDGVTLAGTRALSTAEGIGITAPLVKWSNDSGKDYEGIDQLSEIIEEARLEVYAYLFDAKHAPEPQQSLEFDGDGNIDPLDN